MSENGRGTYAVHVLGCKANQYDAQQIRKILNLAGLKAVEGSSSADVVVVHSCAVTGNAIRKSRQTVKQVHAEHPTAHVIVTGCGADQGLMRSLPTMDKRIPPRQGWLGEIERALDDFGIEHGDVDLPDNPDDFGIDRFEGHTRAFLKIQDGCDIGCTFCIVPRLRRKPRDKALDHILTEAKALAWNGHKEIIISGISVGLYGRDGGAHSLPDVLRALIALPEIERLRLSSLHPRELTEELLDVWASSPKMLPHIHLPLQAGSNNVLKAMKRNYTAEEFLAAVNRAKRALDRPAINNDVIVGFPGESDKDFEETLLLCKEVGFSRMHVFPYSSRPGTRAEQLPNHLDKEIVQERCKRLRGLAAELMSSYHSQFEGERVTALAEAYDPVSGSYQGYTERYIPVRFEADPGLRGQIMALKLTDAGPSICGARVVSDPVISTK